MSAFNRIWSNDMIEDFEHLLDAVGNAYYEICNLEDEMKLMVSNDFDNDCIVVVGDIEKYKFLLDEFIHNYGEVGMAYINSSNQKAKQYVTYYNRVLEKKYSIIDMSRRVVNTNYFEEMNKLLSEVNCL